jgi:hypothetical protein
MKDSNEEVSSPGLDEPLPSLPLTALKPSEPEVAHIFALPLSELASRARLRARSFRNDTARPYWCIDVSDLCLDATAKEGNVSMMDLTVGADDSQQSAPPDRAADPTIGTLESAAAANGCTSAVEWEFVRAGPRETGDTNTLEIWGLTAWYLGLFMRTLGITA